MSALLLLLDVGASAQGEETVPDNAILDENGEPITDPVTHEAITDPNA